MGRIPCQVIAELVTRKFYSQSVKNAGNWGVSAFTFVCLTARGARLRILRLRVVDASDKIRRILKEHGRLSQDAQTLPLNADLYEAGMTSHASVNVMLALEGEFDLEFPDHMLKRSVFESISSISAAIGELQAAAA